MLRRPWVALVLIAGWGMVSLGAAQEEQSDDVIEPPPAVGTVKAFAFGEGGVTVVETATINSGSVPAVWSVASPFGLGADASLEALLSNPQIQEDLTLVDDQLHELNKIRERMREETREHIIELMVSRKDQSDPQMAKEMSQRLQRIRSEAQEEFQNVLLPHQLDRIEQLRLHMRLQNQGTANALTGGELAETLGLSDQQKESLQKRAAELEKEMQKEIQRLRKEAREKLLSELTSEQRSKLEKMLGDDFDYQPPQHHPLPRAVPPPPPQAR